ncbi:MAG: hypothetical protein KDI11_05635, partial [Alphaproteobacteria bacterium]|nr:hypothetical protein [Alphaproteobacteria bacterium]
GGPAQTALTQLTGQNYLKDMPMAVNKAGQNVSANMLSATGAAVDLEQVEKRIGVVEQAVTNMQQPFRQAFDVGAEKLGFDRASVGASFEPGSPTQMIDVIADMAGMKAGIPAAKAVTTAMNIADAVSSAKTIVGKLSPENEAKIADMVRALLTPETDPMTSKETGPPAIPSALNTQGLASMKPHELVGTMKQIMLPPSEHPEMKQLLALKSELSMDVGVHEGQRNTNEAALAMAEETGFSLEDLTIDEADIVLNVAEAAQDFKDQAAGVQGFLNDGFAGMVSQSEIQVSPEMAAYALKAGGMSSIEREKPSIGQDREDELVRLAQAAAQYDSKPMMGA